MVTYQRETLLAPRKRSHSEKVLLHAASRFSLNTRLADPAEVSREFRTFLKVEDQRLKMGPGSVLGGNLGVDAIQEFRVERNSYSAEFCS